MSGIEYASTQSIRPFKSCEEYLYAMKEDLAEWLKDLYGVNITVQNMVQALETGALLCAHANNVTRAAAEFQRDHGHKRAHLPASGVTFTESAQPATFLARDNVSNFIKWCRKEMHIKDVLMFETDDLVLRKNEKNVVLCLLEVARRASRFGMAAPVLIQLEEEIEKEIHEEKKQPVVQRRLINIDNLDEMVQYLISRCTCPSQFPMVKISEGKYRVGDSSAIIFVRILRNHVMVRVGGGWDTLEHYLDKHDPCRCTSLSHKLVQRPATPIHEIKARQCGPSGQDTSQISLVLSRTQSPLDPVIWTPSVPTKIHKSEPGLKSLYPMKISCQQTHSDYKEDFTSRTSRETSRVFASLRLSSSLPRPARPSTLSRPETQQPIVLQKVCSPTISSPQQGPYKRIENNWTKSKIVSNLRQNATTGAKNNQDFQSALENPVVSVSTRPFHCVTPVQGYAHNNSLVSHQDSQDICNPRNCLEFLRTFSPTKELTGVVSGDRHTSFYASNKKCQSPDSSPQRTRIQVHDNTQPSFNSVINTSKSEIKKILAEPTQSVALVNAKNKCSNTERSYLFTPPPISPAQEAILYQSLEEEIMLNLQQLDMDSDSENEQDCHQLDTQINSTQILNEIRQPSIHNTSSGASYSSDMRKVSFETVICEFSKERRPLEKVCVESWVHNSFQSLKAEKQASETSSDIKHLDFFKRSMANSWSSLGSSMDSRDSTEPSKANNTGTGRKEKPQTPPSYQRRSLKKPLRVPSIYKLKLRPCARPRRDHRPDKKPTKIPKPVCYSKSRSLVDTTHFTLGQNIVISDFQKGHNVSHRTSIKRHLRKTSTFKFSATNCNQGDREIMADQEFWV